MNRQLPPDSLSRRLTRRGLLTLGAAAVSGLGLAAVAGVRDAQAVDWCWDDPVIQLGSKQLVFWTGVEGAPSFVHSRIRAAKIIIQVPNGLPVRVVRTTNNHFPEVVHFQRTSASWQPGQQASITVNTTFDTTTMTSVGAQQRVTYPTGVWLSGGATIGNTLTGLFFFFTLPL